MKSLSSLPLFWKAALVSFLLSAVFLNNFLFHLGDPMFFAAGALPRDGLSHGDEAHVLITLKHYMDVFGSGNWGDILNVPIFYGFKDTLLYSEPFLLQAILVTPFYFLSHNIVASFHIVAYLTIALSFLATILLAEYLTKKFWPSVLAAVIFSFNPFIFARFPEHITYYTLISLPLIFLYLEKFLKEHKAWDGFLFFLFLTLNLMSVLTFSVMLMIILPVYFLVRLWQTNFKLKFFINKGVILGAILFLVVTIGMALVYYHLYSKQSIGRGIETTAYYSAWPTDFLIASGNNLIYGQSRDILNLIFPGIVFIGYEYTEHSLFAGIVPIGILLISFWFFRKKGERGYYFLLLGLLVLSAILAMGPIIFINEDINFYGPYLLLFKIDPFLQFIRAASRFSIFYFLFLGLICSLVFTKLKNKLSSAKGDWIVILIIALVVVEYWNWPWDFMQIPPETAQFYTHVDQSPNIKVIMELPMGNLAHTELSDAYNQNADAFYMLYAAMFHSKKLLNGYSSYIPPKYVSQIEYYSNNFPTPIKLKELKKLGVDGIVLHRQGFFNPSDFDRIRSALLELKVPVTISSPDMLFFDLTKWNL